ncbi:hypothetical protein RU01_03260 [Rhodococcus sp. MEB064]|nr:hypothetical protein RU01_03260 [Rhodococcus sp. MEB064]
MYDRRIVRTGHRTDREPNAMSSDPVDNDRPDPLGSDAFRRLLRADGDVAQSLADALSIRIESADDVLELAARVSALAVRYVPGVDSAAVTLAFDTVRPFTAAATDQSSSSLDRAQYDIGDGPSLRALRTGTVVDMSVDDLDGTWSVLARFARSAGIGRITAYPVLSESADTLGTVNLYSRNTARVAPTHVCEDVIAVLVTYLCASLTTLGLESSWRRAADRVKDLMDARVVIDLAIGILMIRRDCDLPAAVSALNDLAFGNGTTLHDAAVAVVDSIDGV